MKHPMHRPPRPLPTAGARRQRGLSLVFALMTLVALALAAVALIRSVDNGTLVLGNLGFKQDTLLASDDATRTALNWLNNLAASDTLHSHGAAGTGYYASVNLALDPTGTATAPSRDIVDWDNNDCAATTAGTFQHCIKASNPALSLSNGVTARYVIIRLCSSEGATTGTTVHCAKPLTAGNADNGQRGSFSYATQRPTSTATSSPYYRVLVRTVGGRNTVTYTETLVHF